MKVNKYFFSKKLILCLILLLFILNPYTVFGNLGLFLMPLILVPFLKGFKGLNLDVLILSLVFVAIAMVGVLSSFVHGIGQFVHLKVALSLVIYILMAHGLYYLFCNDGFDFNEFLHCVLIVASFNSLVIIFEVYFPSFRQTTEQFLVPSGNIDWTEGFRYRGIASGGGASLSVLIPVSIVICLHLYAEKYLGLVGSIIHISILLFSVFFIGRTGIVLLPFVVLFFVVFHFKKYLFRAIVCVVLFAVVAFTFFDYIKQALIHQYGVEFYNYAVGFLLSGSKGLENEGTVGIIIEFLTVMPKTFPEVFIGYGFYGGSEFEPWTDSGYSRMFLSVGYIFGLLFYLLFFLIFRSVFLYKPFIFFTIGVLLLIAETKEPLLFTGYSARLYILILVIGLLSKRRKYQINPRTNDSLAEMPAPGGIS